MRKIFNPAVIVGLSIVVAAAILVYGFVIYKKPSLQNTVQVKKVNITQSVAVTGTVTAANNVSLSFQRGGQVSYLVGDVGTKVYKGETIATVSGATLQAELTQAKAALQTEEIKLNNLQSPESNASSSLQVSITNAQQSLLTQLRQSAASLDTTLAANVDPLFDNARTNPNFGTTIIQNGTTYSITAPSYQLELKINQERSSLDSDTQTWTNLISIASASHAVSDILAAESEGEKVLLNTQTLIADMNTALGSYVATDSTSQAIYNGYKQSLAQAAGTVNTAETNIRNSSQGIASSQAPVSTYDISLQQSAVTSAQAQIDNIQAQISQGTLTSPISGVITMENIKYGENASVNSPIIDVQSSGKFQIDTYVSEADINSLKVGGNADVSLLSDATGNSNASSTLYHASIVSVDPAETMQSGIGSYKVTLQFANEDTSIKSGMTANVNFIISSQINVLAVPESALISKDNQSFVIIPDANGQTQTKPVTTGIRGNGYVQILSGLSEGDSIIQFGNN